MTTVDGSLITTLGLGFALGLGHALDADHVVAVSTLVSQDRGVLRSCLRGAFWGLGHTVALLVAGAAVFAFKVQISPGVERAIETAVGVMLILLGGHVLFRTLGAVSLHRHEHFHGGASHSHLHVHVGDRDEHGHLHLWRGASQPLLIGLLHGVAGSGALVLLALASLPSPAAALAYILVFGVGSTAGMLALSGMIGVPFAVAAGRSRTLALVLRTIVGGASLLVGASMVARGLA
jgi:hypothetical protein